MRGLDKEQSERSRAPGNGGSQILSTLLLLLHDLVLGVSKTTLRFTDFHEGLTELRKAVMLPVLVYYSERRTDKITKEKGKGTGSRRDQVRASGCPLPAESQEQCLIRSSVMHDNTQGG